ASASSRSQRSRGSALGTAPCRIVCRAVPVSSWKVIVVQYAMRNTRWAGRFGASLRGRPTGRGRGSSSGSDTRSIPTLTDWALAGISSACGPQIFSPAQESHCDSAMASEGATRIEARYHCASVMASTVFGLVLDGLQFVALGLRSRQRLAAENLFLRKQLAL